MIHQKNMCDIYHDMNISKFEYFTFEKKAYYLRSKSKIFIIFFSFRVGIEYTQGQEQNAYLAATYVKKESPKEEKKLPAPVIPEAGSESDSDSN